jgi:hypothetical protein
VLLEEVQQMLVNGGFGTAGVDIKFNQFDDTPTAPEAQVLIVEYRVDTSPKRTMGPAGSVPSCDVERFQIVCRNPDRQLAWTKAKSIRNSFDWFDGTVLSVAYFNVMLVGTLGELQENGPYRVAGSYEAWKARS